jgi:hypothetical protein
VQMCGFKERPGAVWSSAVPRIASFLRGSFVPTDVDPGICWVPTTGIGTVQRVRYQSVVHEDPDESVVTNIKGFL